MISNLRDLLTKATLPADSLLPAPSAMLVFAHPDDEVIGLGARLARYQSAVIVHITDGAPRNEQDIRSHGFSCREEYRARRKSELCLALQTAGIEGAQQISLDIPDQEASLHLSYLIRELHKLIRIHAPEVVFTHPYEGGHPDHDACAFTVRRAATLAEDTGKPAPILLEAVFYHLGFHGIETGCFLQPEEIQEEILWPLSPQERSHKQALLACFSSQQDMLRYFTSEHERFRIAPKYNFHKPPHAGKVFYEHYAWGMTAQRFGELTRAVDMAGEACR